MIYQDLGGKISEQMRAFTSWMIIQEGIVAPNSTSILFPGKISVGELFKACQGTTRDEAFTVLNFALQSRLRENRAAK